MADPHVTDHPAHPAFSAHFTDPVYDDTTAEFAPFGTDEGADLRSAWTERSAELDATSTVRDLLEAAVGEPADVDELVRGLRSTASDDDEPGSGSQPRVSPDDDDGDEALTDEPDGADAVGAASTVVGAGFTLLRLTGTIDPEGTQLVLRALDALEAYYGEQDEFATMRSDLESFS